MKDGKLDEENIFQKLVYKANFFFEAYKVKCSIPDAWKIIQIEHKQSPCITVDDILETVIDIPFYGKKTLKN